MPSCACATARTASSCRTTAAASTESGRATIDSLPEVIQVVRDRVPVLVDGGFRRGTDVFKALALGARAICIGRPYMWGVAAFGQPGVETVLAILRREFNLVMAQCGKQSLGDIRAIIDCQRQARVRHNSQL